MIEQTAKNKVGRWSPPEIPFAIEYPLDVMDGIRAQIGHDSEVGGVLFGARDETSILIVTWRPISPEHPEDPGLGLSASDRRDLVRVLLAAKQDPVLQDLQPVGWFVSRSSGDISLNQADLEIYNGYFGEPWQVALILRPAATGAARAGFFAREANGSLRSASSYQEFDIMPLDGGSASHETSPFATLGQRATWLRWVWAIPVVLAVILVGVFLRQRASAPSLQGFTLQLQDDGPRLQISWDRNSAPIRAASRAEMDIQDGSQPSHFSFDAARLRTGQMSWQRHADDVQVRMTVFPDAGGALRECARLRIVTVSLPAPQPDPAQAHLKQLNEELRIERTRADRLRNMVKILENRIEVDAARK